MMMAFFWPCLLVYDPIGYIKSLTWKRISKYYILQTFQITMSWLIIFCTKTSIMAFWSVAAFLLLLSGDVETNPGPKKGAPKEPAGPTPEQRITELETKVKTYEEQIGSKYTNWVIIIKVLKSSNLSNDSFVPFGGLFWI